MVIAYFPFLSSLLLSSFRCLSELRCLSPNCSWDGVNAKELETCLWESPLFPVFRGGPRIGHCETLNELMRNELEVPDYSNEYNIKGIIISEHSIKHHLIFEWVSEWWTYVFLGRCFFDPLCKCLIILCHWSDLLFPNIQLLSWCHSSVYSELSPLPFSYFNWPHLKYDY